jgi:hypothetical protein
MSEDPNIKKEREAAMALSMSRYPNYEAWKKACLRNCKNDRKYKEAFSKVTFAPKPL